MREVSMFLRAKDIHKSLCVLIQSSHTLTPGRMMDRRSNAQRSSTEASANRLPPWREPAPSPPMSTGENCPWGNWYSSSSDSSFLGSSCCCWMPSSWLAAVSSRDSSVIGLISPGRLGSPGVLVFKQPFEEFSLWFMSLSCGCVVGVGTSSVIWVHASNRVVLSWRARENARPT